MGNLTIKNVIFHDNISAPADGTIIQINGQEELVNISFISNSASTTTFVANFEAMVTENDDWHPITGANLKNLDFGITATTFDIYQLDLNGLFRVRVRVSELTGNLSVYGRVV